MAISPLEQDTVSRGIKAAGLVIRQLKPLLDELNVVYDAAGGVKDTLTQQELDEIARFSGITKQQVDDGMFALTSTLKTAITNAYTQLTTLASREA